MFWDARRVNLCVFPLFRGNPKWGVGVERIPKKEDLPTFHCLGYLTTIESLVVNVNGSESKLKVKKRVLLSLRVMGVPVNCRVMRVK